MSKLIYPQSGVEYPYGTIVFRGYDGWGGIRNNKKVTVYNTEALINISQHTNITNLQLFNLDNYARTRIIGILPNTIRKLLICFAKNIIIEKDLPNNLEKLIWESSQLTKLPQLPQSLLEIYVRDNLLEELPELPEKLVELECEYNSLRVLPRLNYNLCVLRCDNNMIEELPELPKTLRHLHCGNNKLRKMPNLVGLELEHLVCDNNYLTSLPQLPQTLRLLNCSYNTELSYISSLPIRLSMLIYVNTRLYEMMDSFILPERIRRSGGDYKTIKQIRIRNLNTYHNFLDLYYTLKYKNQFIKWLWKSREKRIQEQYAPEKLKELLEANEGEDLSEILEKWE